MKSKILYIFCLVTIHFMPFIALAQEKTEARTESSTPTNIFPLYKGTVNDYGQLLAKPEQDSLSKIIKDYEIITSRKILVVTVDSITPYTNILTYAKDLEKNWKFRTNKPNNGLTIVVCKPTQQIAIATGEGVGSVLTNEVCQEIISEEMIPAFKKENFYKGIKNGLLALIKQWN